MVVDSKCASANSEHQRPFVLPSIQERRGGSLGIRWRLAVGIFFILCILFSRTLLASDGLVTWLPRQFLVVDGIYLCACNTTIYVSPTNMFWNHLCPAN